MKELDLLTMGMIVVLAMVVMKLLDRGIDFFFNRLTKDDIITLTHCTQCKIERKESDNDFRREMREKLGIITGALVVIAAGKEVSMDDIQKLVSSSAPK